MKPTKREGMEDSRKQEKMSDSTKRGISSSMESNEFSPVIKKRKHDSDDEVKASTSNKKRTCSQERNEYSGVVKKRKHDSDDLESEESIEKHSNVRSKKTKSRKLECEEDKDGCDSSL